MGTFLKMFAILLALVVAMMLTLGCNATSSSSGKKMAVEMPLQTLTEAPAGMPASVSLLVDIVASDLDCTTCVKTLKQKVAQDMTKRMVRVPEHIRLEPLSGSTFCGVRLATGTAKAQLTLSWNQIGDDELWRAKVTTHQIFGFPAMINPF